jgi:hypothetical protein
MCKRRGAGAVGRKGDLSDQRLRPDKSDLIVIASESEAIQNLVTRAGLLRRYRSPQ